MTPPFKGATRSISKKTIGHSCHWGLPGQKRFIPFPAKRYPRLRRCRSLAAKVTADRSGPDHPRTVFTLDLTSADGLFSADQFEIQPGDLVYVSESPLTAAGSILAALGSVIGLTN